MPTGAFGWNSQLMLFTMNYVATAEGFLGGLGRVFVARDLLEMTSLEDGIEKITRSNMGAGHNYQLFDLKNQNIRNVEVSTNALYSVRAIQSGQPAFFHANQYETLNISQIYSNSSLHRLARAKVLLADRPIETPADMIHVIGDQGDVSWPIYHDNLSHQKGELSDWTLCTLFVDPIETRLEIYLNNPRSNKPVLTVNLTDHFGTLKNEGSENKSYRPVVIMHGMNNNEKGYEKNIEAIQAQYPGIYMARSFLHRHPHATLITLNPGT